MGKRVLIIVTVLLVGVFSMALWDKDKNSNNRLSPQTNSRDVNKSRQAHGTMGFTLKQEDDDGTLGKLVFKDGKLSLIKQDGTVVNVNGDGMKVAQPGFDAETTADENLVMTSELNLPKILARGSVVINPSDTGSPNYTVGIGQTTQTVTFSNPSGKTPMVLASFKASTTFTVGAIDVWTATPQPIPFFLPGAPSIIISYDTPSTTSVRFQYAQFSSINWGQDLFFTVSYYIFVETSSLD